MDADLAGLPDDLEALKTALLAERARADAAQIEAAVARAEQSEAQALIVHLKLQIEKLRREIFGPRSERSVHSVSTADRYGPRRIKSVCGSGPLWWDLLYGFR